MLNKNFSKFARKQITIGQSFFAEKIMSMVQLLNEPLFDTLDLENRKIFLDPLLFALPHSNGDQIPLEQILFGYIEPQKRPSKIRVVSNSAGLVCLPNIGHLQTDINKTQYLHLTVNSSNQSIYLHHGEKLIDYSLQVNPRISRTSIEFCSLSAPLLESFLHVRKDLLPRLDATVINDRYLPPINNAVNILRELYPDFFDCLNLTTKWIVPFESQDSNSLATLVFHGAGFLNMYEDRGVLFCLEDIVHQCGHVIFNAITHSPQEHFKIQPETPLQEIVKDVSDDPEDRSIYDVFHGVFTESLMCDLFAICLKKNIFHGLEEHELKGRFTYIFIRFLLDMESLNRDIFSEKGLLIYQALQNKMLDLYREYRSLPLEFDITNQPYNFNFDKFLSLNPLL